MIMRPIQYVEDNPGGLSRVVYTARLGDMYDAPTTLALSTIEWQVRPSIRHRKWEVKRAWYRSESAGRFAYRNYGVQIEALRPVVPQAAWDGLWKEFTACWKWRDGDGIIRKGDGA